MSKLKVAFSILALLLMAAATVTTVGVGQVPGWLPELLEGGGMMLSWAGYQPWVLPQRASMICATLSMMAAGFVTSHATMWGDGNKHVALLVVAWAGAITGVLARGLPPKRRPDLDPVQTPGPSPTS